MAERKTPPPLTHAQSKRQSALAYMAHLLRGAMSGKGAVRVTLKNRAEQVGIPTQIAIDRGLSDRLSNLRIYMNGYDFPLDDVENVSTRLPIR